MTFLEGEGLSFAIQVAGVPTPSTVWYQDGKELVSDYSLDIAGDGSLAIPSVEPRHSGSYKLVVTNQAGSIKRTVEVGYEEKRAAFAYAIYCAQYTPFMYVHVYSLKLSCAYYSTCL